MYYKRFHKYPASFKIKHFGASKKDDTFTMYHPFLLKCDYKKTYSFSFKNINSYLISIFLFVKILFFLVMSFIFRQS